MIVLVPPSRRSVTRAVSRATAAPAQWAYLGTSIRTREAVARWLGPVPRRIAFSGLLQGTAASLRGAYIEYIGRLGVERDSPDWWFSSLSDKDPLTYNAFLQVCYVAVAAELCRGHKDAGTLVLVAERPEVRRAIAAHLRESGAPFVAGREPVAARLARAVREWVEMAARRVYWIGRQAARMAAARALGFSSGVMNGEGEARPWALLHSWIDRGCVTAQGGYRDDFFGPLREEMQKRGSPVAVVATVLSHSPYRRILASLKRSGIPVLVPEAALTLRALLGWISSLPFLPPAPRPWPRFQGFDVSAILDEVERRDWVNPRAASVRMLADIVAQWRRNLDARAFIYTYEGQSWERGYCKAFREHFPKARLIGYQHALPPPQILSFFISPAEWGKVPFPDRVVANGSYGYDLLRGNGIPERALACGSALQYNAPGGAAPAPDGGQAGRPAVVRVLVALPILKTQSAELLLAALGAFADPQAFHVAIKFHPRFPAARVLREAGVASFPSHVRVVREPMPDLLRKADVLLYTYSASAVEALTAGVPIVHFAPACDIDLDPLAGFDDIRHSTGTVEGLREAVRAVVTAAPAEREARMRRGREIRDRFWQPPDEKTFDLFMPENVQ